MEECVDGNEKDREMQWISNVLDGRKEDYAFVVNRYKNKIYGLLRGMGADHQDAQDLTQETFIKAYRKLASHDTNKSLAAWLYTIAANLLKDTLRRSRPTEWLADPPHDHMPGKNPEMVLLQEEQRTEVQLLIQQLPLNYRIVLLLRYTNDLSYEEMSEVLDVPLNKIQNDLYRAKKRLKKMMTVKEVRTDGMLKPR